MEVKNLHYGIGKVLRGIAIGTFKHLSIYYISSQLNKPYGGLAYCPSTCPKKVYNEKTSWNKIKKKIMALSIIATMISLVFSHPGFPDVDGAATNYYHQYTLPHHIQQYTRMLSQEMPSKQLQGVGELPSPNYNEQYQYPCCESQEVR